jgi:glycine cleavage system H protein
MAAHTNVPDDRRYTDQHEWVLVQGGEGGGSVVRVGITDHAQDALGDIVFVQLPAVGDEVAPGNPMGEVESTKSVSDLYAPVTAKVVAVNGDLEATPELVNSDPYGEGWLVELQADAAALEEGLRGLLDADGYRNTVTE